MSQWHQRLSIPMIARAPVALNLLPTISIELATLSAIDCACKYSNSVVAYPALATWSHGVWLVFMAAPGWDSLIMVDNIPTAVRQGGERMHDINNYLSECTLGRQTDKVISCMYMYECLKDLHGHSKACWGCAIWLSLIVFIKVVNLLEWERVKTVLRCSLYECCTLLFRYSALSVAWDAAQGRTEWAGSVVVVVVSCEVALSRCREVGQTWCFKRGGWFVCLNLTTIHCLQGGVWGHLVRPALAPFWLHWVGSLVLIVVIGQKTKSKSGPHTRHF